MEKVLALFKSLFHKLPGFGTERMLSPQDRKNFSVGMMIWGICLLLTLGIYLFSRSMAEKSFYKSGAAITQDVVDKIGTSMLEKDILKLNNAVNWAVKRRGVLFVSVTDHEDIIIVNTNPELIGKREPRLKDAKDEAHINDIRVISGYMSNGSFVYLFDVDLMYSNIKIGRLQIALPPDQFKQKTSDLNLYFVFGFIVFSVVYFLLLKFVYLRLKPMDRLDGTDTDINGSFGPYIIQKKIAEGGMAELFLANIVRDDGFRRAVVIKKVLPSLSKSPEFINMFIREARVAALLHHPNVVGINDFGRIKSDYFITMEYIHGKNLAEILNRVNGGLSIDQAIFITSQICLGLYYSHSKKDDRTGEPLNIVHRDINPQNILISYQGEVKISDFGISKARSEPNLTKVGILKGKPSYLAPEQALGQGETHQTDIYMLGIVFYEMLAGEKLYEFENEIEAIKKIPKQELVPIRSIRPDVPEELNRIVMKSLEKNKMKRYQTAKEIHDDLMMLKQLLNVTYDSGNLSDFMNEYFEDETQSSG